MFIGIDIGTTTLKGALLDVDEMRVSDVLSSNFPASISSLEPGYFEVPAAGVVESVKLLIEELLSRTPNCQGIVMCSQMHGLVLVNNQQEALTNIITWRDDRALQPSANGAQTYFDLLSAAISEADKIRLGNNLAPNRPLAVLYTELEKFRQGKVSSLPEGALAVTLPDFVVSAICGSPPVTDITNAVATAAFDYSTFNWHHELLARLSLDYIVWPRIARFGEVAGYLEMNGRKLPFYLPVGDQQCSLLGTLLTDHELSLNISTGSQVSMISRHLVLDSSFQTVPYFDDTFLKTLVHVPAGRALNALLRLLSELAIENGSQMDDPWPYIEQAVAEVGESEMIVDLAFFPSSCGEKGSIQSITEPSLTVGHLFAAAFRNMADNYYKSALVIDPLKQWQKLVVSGGLAAKSEGLQRSIRKAFPDDIVIVTRNVDSAIRGLLTMASVLSGRFESTLAAVQMMHTRDTQRA